MAAQGLSGLQASEYRRQGTWTEEAMETGKVGADRSPSRGQTVGKADWGPAVSWHG